MLLSRPILPVEPTTILASPLASAQRPSWLELIGEAFGNERGCEAGLAAFWGRFPGSPEIFVLTERGGVVGTVSIRRAPGTTEGYIHLLAVRRSHRRRGLGLGLIHYASASLARQGATHVLAGTQHDDAVRLYRRAGFAPVGACA